MAESPRQTVLFRNATVISMDSDNKFLKNCDIMIQDSEIVQVGPKLSIGDDEANFQREDSKLETIDATDCIIAPGFIDGHHHLWQQLIRSVATDWCMADYMSHVRRCYGSLYTAENVYFANHVAALDLICHGVTTVVDHCHILNSPAHADAAVQALKDASIRRSFCYGFYENPALPSDFRSIDTTSSDHDTIRRIEDARRIRYKYFATNRWEHELLTFGVAPDEAEAVPIDVLKEQIRIGRELLWSQAKFSVVGRQASLPILPDWD